MGAFPKLKARLEKLCSQPVENFLNDGDILVERELAFLRELHANTAIENMSITDPDDIDILIGGIVTDTVGQEIVGLVYRWMILNSKDVGMFYYSELSFCRFVAKAEFDQKSKRGIDPPSLKLFSTAELFEILEWFTGQYSEYRSFHGADAGMAAELPFDERDIHSTYLKSISAISSHLANRLMVPSPAE